MWTLSKWCVLELPLPCINKVVKEAIQGASKKKEKIQFGYCKVKKLMVKKNCLKTLPNCLSIVSAVSGGVPAPVCQSLSFTSPVHPSTLTLSTAPPSPSSPYLHSAGFICMAEDVRGSRYLLPNQMSKNPQSFTVVKSIVSKLYNGPAHLKIGTRLAAVNRCFSKKEKKMWRGRIFFFRREELLLLVCVFIFKAHIKS